MKKAVVLLSGGLDSTTCIALAKKQGFACYAISFHYDQKHAAELNAANKIAALFAVEHHRIDLPSYPFSSSAAVNEAVQIEDYEPTSAAIPNTYVPARNTVFLANALAYAELIQAHDIFIGVSAIDYSHYPDCRPEYIAAFEKMANLATKIGVEEGNIKIHAPLLFLSKAETIKLGQALGVDYAMTVSCYRADQAGRACGRCNSCGLRKKGFAEANVADPTNYATSDSR